MIVGMEEKCGYNMYMDGIFDHRRLCRIDFTIARNFVSAFLIFSQAYLSSFNHPLQDAV